MGIHLCICRTSLLCSYENSLCVGTDFLQPTFNKSSTSPLAHHSREVSELLGYGPSGPVHQQLFSGELDLLGQQFCPVANTKHNLATVSQSSRQADPRHEAAATAQSFHQADTRELQFNPEETLRLVKQPEAKLQKQQSATGTLQAVLGQVYLNGSFIIH